MATSTKYNDFGKMVIDNRFVMNSIDADDVGSSKQWAEYLSICDGMAVTCYRYLADTTGDNFPAFRSAIHRLFTYAGMDTRIMAIDAYTVRFIPAIVAYKTVKSQAYKDAEKAVRQAVRASEWICDVSGVNAENPDAVLFPKVSDTVTVSDAYYNQDAEAEYNFCVKLWNANGKSLTVADMNTEVARLEKVRDDLAAIPGNFYKDFKDPMKSSNGKALKHAPMSVRKGIEDTLADLLTARNYMTEDQLNKEEAQIKGGRK